ncbi:porin family protein [Spirosoma sordidisoli]|uniref:PorT family protein n=1 Tax=Spirosoma sordidisoli TaxID=2502893 RepID=A0A4Q2UGT9_9BACT|nr:porin family protein [Spirosoma sordidisoli]RYC66645.1 PorT family protein [Spirosoma sordidisoli]
MKTIGSFSVVLGMLLISTSTFSQVSANFGPKFGINYSQLSFSGADRKINNRYATGFQGGAFLRINVGRFYLQPEAVFNEKGSKISFDATPGNRIDGKVKLQSLDIPLLLGVKLIDGERINLRIMAGPMYSRQLKNESAVLEKLSPSARFKQHQYGYQAGLGIDLANLILEARYEGGLEKLIPELDGRPGSFAFSVGFKIL